MLLMVRVCEYTCFGFLLFGFGPWRYITSLGASRVMLTVVETMFCGKTGIGIPVHNGRLMIQTRAPSFLPDILQELSGWLDK